jgi:hypothetical protein
MSGMITVPEATEKEKIIEKLLHSGVYKARNRQLYELSLQELEYTYHQLLKKTDQVKRADREQQYS